MEATQEARIDRASTRQAPIVSRGLTRSFGSKVALKPLDVAVGRPDRGSIVGLLGPNGSGKSTFMRMLVGLVRPDAGTAEVDGIALRGDGTAIRKRTTYAPGELHLYGELGAEEHLRWLLRGRDSGAVDRALNIARSFALPLERRVRGFSHGMKRQLVFAAALAPAVRVRILDEPTEGLDPSIRSTILDLLEEDAAAGTTILLSSHHLGEVDRSCERLLFMNQGVLLADTTAEEVAARSGRLLRLGWANANDRAIVEKALRESGLEVQAQGDAGLTITLPETDPRPFLGSLAQHQEWPAPIHMEHGRLSMLELYRELYGVEGC